MLCNRMFPSSMKENIAPISLGKNSARRSVLAKNSRVIFLSPSCDKAPLQRLNTVQYTLLTL